MLPIKENFQTMIYKLFYFIYRVYIVTLFKVSLLKCNYTFKYRVILFHYTYLVASTVIMPNVQLLL